MSVQTYSLTITGSNYKIESNECPWGVIGSCGNVACQFNSETEEVKFTDRAWRNWAPILEAKAEQIEVTDADAGYSGEVLDFADLVTYLQGVMVSPEGGGGGGDSVAWGDITGSLSNQSDLSTALEGKQDTLTAGTGISINNNVISATGGGGSQVQADWNQTDTSAVDYIKNKPTLRQPSADGTAGQYLKSGGSGNAPTWETLDTTPTESSTKAITSGAVYTALDGKQATLTFDNAPTENSTNPVKSGGVYTALEGKADASTARFMIHAEYNTTTGAVTLASGTTQASLMSALTAKKAMDIDFTVAGTYYQNPMLSFYEDGTGAHEVRFRNDAMGFDVVLKANTTSNTYTFEVEQFIMTESAYGNLSTVNPDLIYFLTADPQS